jgi:phosphate:Na+ symporter
MAMGGLGLLLFGFKMVSGGLETVAGDQLQVILKKATANRFLAAIVGVIVTVAINSSTAVSIILVGFVNASIMTLTQAMGVLLGVNVGTTFSALLFSFKIDAYAPMFILLGAIMYLFFKKKVVKNIGYVVLAFGILFFSINVMGSALKEFQKLPAFEEMITSVNNPFLALLIGFVITVIIQSSSATMGLLVTMHLAGFPISLMTSAFIIFGANIGTSTTAVIASLPGSRDGRRTALFHITYDLIGSSVFGPLVLMFPQILNWFEATWVESARQVAMIHMLYNIATLCLLIGFVPLLAKLMNFIIPVKQDETREIHEKKMLYLDTKTQVPSIAVMNAQMEINRMGKIANENLKTALESFFERNPEKAHRIIENEKTVDFLHQNITDGLVDITNMSLSRNDARRVGDMFVIVSNIEQISDHAKNVAEHTLVVCENNKQFSEAAIEELQELSTITTELIDIALAIYEKQDESRVTHVQELENRVDDLSKKFTREHFKRLKSKTCKNKSGIIFMDILVDLEQSADNAENIALTVVSR